MVGRYDIVPNPGSGSVRLRFSGRSSIDGSPYEAGLRCGWARACEWADGCGCGSGVGAGAGSGLLFARYDPALLDGVGLGGPRSPGVRETMSRR